MSFLIKWSDQSLEIGYWVNVKVLRVRGPLDFLTIFGCKEFDSQHFVRWCNI